MRGYFFTDVFSKRAIGLYERAVQLVEELEAPTVLWVPSWCDPHYREIRCHELARALGAVLDLPWVDGKVGPADHTWLWIEHEPVPALGASRGVILDPYAPGRYPMVQLVHPVSLRLRSEAGTFSPEDYRPGDRRTDIDEGVVKGMMFEFLEAETIRRAGERFARERGR